MAARATKKYENMSVEELDEVKLEIKEEIKVLQAEYDSVNAFRIVAVEDMHYDEAIKQLTRVAAERGVEIEAVADDWIDDGDRGHYIQANWFRSRKEK